MDNQIVFNHTGHKELWQWLVNNPMMEKEDWPGWDYNGGTYDRAMLICFACEYDKQLGNTCECCPLVWKYIHCKNGSEYERWDDSWDSTERSQLAAQIRDLKVKPGVVCV